MFSKKKKKPKKMKKQETKRWTRRAGIIVRTFTSSFAWRTRDLSDSASAGKFFPDEVEPRPRVPLAPFSAESLCPSLRISFRRQNVARFHGRAPTRLSSLSKNLLPRVPRYTCRLHFLVEAPGSAPYPSVNLSFAYYFATRFSLHV